MKDIQACKKAVEVVKATLADIIQATEFAEQTAPSTLLDSKKIAEFLALLFYKFSVSTIFVIKMCLGYLLIAALSCPFYCNNLSSIIISPVENIKNAVIKAFWRIFGGSNKDKTTKSTVEFYVYHVVS